MFSHCPAFLSLHPKRHIRSASLPNKVMFMTCSRSSQWSEKAIKPPVTIQDLPLPRFLSLHFPPLCLPYFVTVCHCHFFFTPHHPWSNTPPSFNCLLSSTTSLSCFLLFSFSPLEKIKSFFIIKHLCHFNLSITDMDIILDIITFSSLSSSSSAALYLTGAACDNWQGSRGRRVRTSWTWMSSAAWKTAWPLRPTRGGSAGWSRRK